MTSVKISKCKTSNKYNHTSDKSHAIYYHCISSKVDVSMGKTRISPTAGNHRIQTTVVEGGASHTSEHRRGLGDACVLAVPADYAGASSVSGDHPQQYYISGDHPWSSFWVSIKQHYLSLSNRPKLTTLEEKDFFPIFYISKKIFFTVTHSSEIVSPEWPP